MKKLLLPLLLLSALSTQARFATTMPFPVAASPVRPVMNGLTGYIEGQEMVSPYSNDGITYVYDTDPYFFFTNNGPYGTLENVQVSLESADPGVQLFGGFDEAPNVWQLKVIPIDGQPANAYASCTIRVVYNYQEFFYNIQLLAH